MGDRFRARETEAGGRPSAPVPGRVQSQTPD